MKLAFLLDPNGVADLFDIQGEKYEAATIPALKHQFVAVEDNNAAIGKQLFVEEVFQVENLEAAIKNYTPPATQPTKPATKPGGTA